MLGLTVSFDGADPLSAVSVSRSLVGAGTTEKNKFFFSKI